MQIRSTTILRGAATANRGHDGSNGVVLAAAARLDPVGGTTVVSGANRRRHSPCGGGPVALGVAWLGSYAAAFAALAALPLLGAGIARRAHRSEAVACTTASDRVGRRSGAAR